MFEEAAHYAADGSLDMVEIMQALIDVGFDGPIRPDHGRAIWGEVSMPGYGLYDRALGSQYLLGLYDALIRQKEKNKVNIEDIQGNLQRLCPAAVFCRAVRRAERQKEKTQ